MPIRRNSSFNPISKSMSASLRRARSTTRWRTSSKPLASALPNIPCEPDVLDGTIRAKGDYE